MIGEPWHEEEAEFFLDHSLAESALAEKAATNVYTADTTAFSRGSASSRIYNRIALQRFVGDKQPPQIEAKSSARASGFGERGSLPSNAVQPL